jgi:FkbM family methyltransferase
VKRPFRALFSNLRGKVKHQPLFEKMLKFALRGMNIGAEIDPRWNGERLILDLVCRIFASNCGPLNIFDVGANRGAYARMVLDELRDFKLRLHLFEPSGDTYQELCRAIHDDRVVANNSALGDSVGTAVLHTSTVHSSLASLYARELPHELRLSGTETVALDTLDRYCGAGSIEQIHLLKLDVEGHELFVLRGGQSMLSAGRIRLIQFEFGGANIDSRTYFRDFWQLLSPCFSLFRIMKDGLYPVSEYRATLEQFVYSNYLAVDASLPMASTVG